MSKELTENKMENMVEDAALAGVSGGIIAEDRRRKKKNDDLEILERPDEADLLVM
jgi:hypothetical protein